MIIQHIAIGMQQASVSGSFPVAFSDWSVRQPITIPAVSTPLANFPVFVRLSNMAPAWWAAVQQGGGDIRVTLADGMTEVPQEVGFCDAINEIGDLYFRATDGLTTEPRTYYIYAGNPVAIATANDSPMGRDSVWGNYRAVWHMGEDPSGPAPQIVDSTGRGNNGTAYGNMPSTASVLGKTGKALSFDGVNDIVLPGNMLGLFDEAETARTFSAWVRTSTDTTTALRVIGINNPVGASACALGLSSRKGRAIYRNTAGALGNLDTSIQIADGIWHLLQMVLNETAVSLWVDGVLRASASDVGPNTYLGGEPDNQATWQMIGLGGAFRGTLPHAALLPGEISEVRFAATVVSQQWSQVEYANQNNPAGWYTIHTLEENT